MKIALLGDIAFFGRKCVAANPDFADSLDGVAAYLKTHDVVIGNLETPFVDGHNAVGVKSAHVSSNSANVALLKRLGVTHVTLANNHIMDYGCGAYLLTKEILEKSGIGYFGVNGREIRFEKGGSRIAMLGYCSYNTNPNADDCKGDSGINILDVDVAMERLRQNARDGYLSVLAVHSGQEHVHLPSRDDICFARYLAQEIDYVYYGHHPHVVQGAEKVGGAHIYYSLGNFVFDDVYTNKSTEPLIKMTEANKTGIIVSLEVCGNAVVTESLVPIYNGDDGIKYGNDVSGFSMENYNRYLEMPHDQYVTFRQEQIKAFVDERAKKRDIKWYLKRMRPASAIQILNGRRNAKLYRAHVASKMDQKMQDSKGVSN